jgi:hypothetical protein
MARLKKTTYEETRVQVSISYDLNPDKKDDDKLLDFVQSVTDFEAVEQQRWGCACIRSGFIIFQGDRIPTKEEKVMMITSVDAALQKCTL